MAFDKQRINTMLKGANNLKKINEKISLISKPYVDIKTLQNYKPTIRLST